MGYNKHKNCGSISYQGAVGDDYDDLLEVWLNQLEERPKLIKHR